MRQNKEKNKFGTLSIKKPKKENIMNTKTNEAKAVANKDFYIVRGDRSGVFFGNIKERNGKEVTMTNVRRLWYWDGAASISQLAQSGTVKPNNCKFTVTVDEIIVLDAIEIDKCTDVAVKNIQGVAEWTKK